MHALEAHRGALHLRRGVRRDRAGRRCASAPRRAPRSAASSSSFLPFIVKAVCAGLKKFPIVNATLDEATQEIVLRKRYHIGIAAATDGRAHRAGGARRRPASRCSTSPARSTRCRRRRAPGKATRDELTGSTFTISSLGTLGGVLATPIINFPEVAILGVHKIKRRRWCATARSSIRDMMNLSISLDHRLVDGYDGAHVPAGRHGAARRSDADVHGDGVTVARRSAAERRRHFAADAPDARAVPGPREDGIAEPTQLPRLGDAELLRMYRGMLRIRVIDERLMALQRQGRIGFYGEARGQEARGRRRGGGARARRLDRAGAARGGRGALPRAAAAHVRRADLRQRRRRLARAGSCRVTRATRAAHYVTMSSCIATQLPHAVGMALAAKIKGDDVGRARLPGRRRHQRGGLPRRAQLRGRVPGAGGVLLPEQPVGDLDAGRRVQTASPTIAVKALAYGFRGVRVDGNDVLAVYGAVKRRGRARARAATGRRSSRRSPIACRRTRRRTIRRAIATRR